MRAILATLAVAVLSTIAACGSGADLEESEQVPDRYPEVVDATARRQTDGTWHFDVTISSPYDGPSRYADAWRIVAADGRVLGIRELAHHHGGEQPFTRSLVGVEIPESIETVTIEGRDLQNGWGGRTLELRLEAAS